MADDAGGKEFDLVGNNVMGADLKRLGLMTPRKRARCQDYLFGPMTQKLETLNLAAAGVQGAELPTGPDKDAK